MYIRTSVFVSFKMYPIFNTCHLYYHPQMKFGKVIFSEVCVKNSVHRRHSASVHAGIPHPLDQAPPKHPLRIGSPQDQIPLDQAPPQEQAPLDQTPPMGPGNPPP